MSEIVRKPPNTVPLPGNIPELGQWYWVKDKDGDWLACVAKVGSNYAKMMGVNEVTMRIHLDDFYETCRFEPNVAGVIAAKVDQRKMEVRQLLAEVEAVTARLGVGYSAAVAIGQGSEGHALAKLTPDLDVSGYKTSLVKAKKEDLPALFKKIESANSSMAKWMKAETLPLKAQLKQMEKVIGRIDTRIYNIELYAGLTEQVVMIRDGEPAPTAERIRLMQRRCYMDEECLAQYQVGGMEFQDIGDFDAWLAKPENCNRILPFPRCVVSFQVRRHTKARALPRSMVEFFNRIDEIDADKLTFLYIRNGERVYRMNTQLEFGEQLFPDVERNMLMSGAQLWVETGIDSIHKIITDAQYHGLIDDYKAAKAAHKVKEAAHKAEHREWAAKKKAAKTEGRVFKEREPFLFLFPFTDTDPVTRHKKHEPGSIFYDDVQKKVANEMQRFNRIGIIIQGLLDRSPVLHPHPPWKIWSSDGFDQALELIYDDSRTLTTGEKPNFEEYRDRLNASLKSGSVTVGQHAAWMRSFKDDDDLGRHSRRQKQKHYNDPGPGVVMRIEKYEPRTGRCHYAWSRPGESRDTEGEEFRVLFKCDSSQVLNVDAYTPGDFKLFFSDARTRAEYLKWAPLLLEAEEYHAGNRKVAPPPPPRRQVVKWENQEAYRRRKAKERLLGKAVKLAREVTTKGGKRYLKGSLWKVVDKERSGLYIRQINQDGTYLADGGSVSAMEPHDLILVDGIVFKEKGSA